jgi:predicted membrane-bound spermidine synthase
VRSPTDKRTTNVSKALSFIQDASQAFDCTLVQLPVNIDILARRFYKTRMSALIRRQLSQVGMLITSRKANR